MNPRIIDDFTGRSAARYRCYLTDQPKREEDHGVICTGITIEGEGSLDLSFAAVEELAHMIGWTSPEEDGIRRSRQEAEVEFHKAVAADAVAQFQALEARVKAEATKAALDATQAAKPRGKR